MSTEQGFVGTIPMAPAVTLNDIVRQGGTLSNHKKYENQILDDLFEQLPFDTSKGTDPAHGP